MADPHTEAQQSQQPGAWLLQDVSNAMVALHTEQFGRGPTKAQLDLAGADALVCIMEDALLPAERTMVEMGKQQRVRESRMFLQVATADQFIATVESITGRPVRAFASATDPDRGVVNGELHPRPPTRPRRSATGGQSVARPRAYETQRKQAVLRRRRRNAPPPGLTRPDRLSTSARPREPASTQSSRSDA